MDQGSSNKVRSLKEKNYEEYLNKLAPFLRSGESLSSAIKKGGASKHRTSLYKKYAQNGYFREKIHQFQSVPAELAKNVVFKTIENVHQKLTENPQYKITKEEARMIIFVATKHRASQPYFLTRNEVRDLKRKQLASAHF